MCGRGRLGKQTPFLPAPPPVAEGMGGAHPLAEGINARRKALLELYLSDHPAGFTWPAEKCGDCRLQDYAYAYGGKDYPLGGRNAAKGSWMIAILSSFVTWKNASCCGQCVRMCGENSRGACHRLHPSGLQAQVAATYEMPLQEVFLRFLRRIAWPYVPPAP